MPFFYCDEQQTDYATAALCAFLGACAHAAYKAHREAAAKEKAASLFAMAGLAVTVCGWVDARIDSAEAASKKVASDLQRLAKQQKETAKKDAGGAPAAAAAAKQ